MSIQRWDVYDAEDSPTGWAVSYDDHAAAVAAAYREGYNAHAAARAKSEQMFGTYQHGSGENP